MAASHSNLIPLDTGHSTHFRKLESKHKKTKKLMRGSESGKQSSSSCPSLFEISFCLLSLIILMSIMVPSVRAQDDEEEEGEEETTLEPGIIPDLQKWKDRVPRFYVSPDPYWVPWLSHVFGLMIPLPKMHDGYDFTVGKPYDFFLSKPERDWGAYQPMWMGGCAEGVMGTLVYEILRILQQLDSWVRDILDTVYVVVKLVACVLLQVGTFVDSRAERLMLVESVWEQPQSQSHPKFYPESRKLPMTYKYDANTVRFQTPLLFRFPYEWDTYKVFPRGILDKYYNQMLSLYKDGLDGSEPVTEEEEGGEEEAEETEEEEAEETEEEEAEEEPEEEAEEEEAEERRKREAGFVELPLVRSKRERLDDRLVEYSLPETEVFRCEKRGLEVVAWLILDFFKAWYYFFPFWNKMYTYGIESILRLAFEIGRFFISDYFVWILDPWWCYQLDDYLGLSLKTGPICKGLLKSLLELWLDIGDLINEDLFVEAIEVAEFFFFDVDNRITIVELDIFSNVTWVKAADSPDKLRWDGTARIDDYYRSYAAKIQCTENYEEFDFDSHEVMNRIKYEWCLAVFTPPINSLARIEYKSVWLSRLVKNDNVFDVGELRCITGPYLDNLVYNAYEENNCTYVSTGQSCMERIFERIDDIVDVLERIHMEDGAWHHNFYLDGVTKLIRALGLIAKRNPFELHLAEIKAISINLASRVEGRLIKEGEGDSECFGHAERRMRVKNEMAILRDLLGIEEDDPDREVFTMEELSKCDFGA